MEKHTPGPWYVRTGPPNGVAVHWSEDGQICPMRWTDGLRPEVEARVAADARLIAAAPELLDALKGLMAQFDAGYFVRNIQGDGQADWAIQAARSVRTLAVAVQVIAKAEGTV